MHYEKNGIIIRKYRSADDPFEWFDLHQIVIPSCFRYKLMSLTHDFIRGNLGVKKSLGKILKYFFGLVSTKMLKNLVAHVNCIWCLVNQTEIFHQLH